MKSHFRIETSNGSDKIEAAVAAANAITRLPEFYEQISGKPELFDQRWTSPEATPQMVANLLKAGQIEIYIKLQKARRRVLGWTYEEQPGVIYLNSRRLDRTPSSIVATLFHEWVHCTDAVSDLDFHHGDNKPHDKQNSAPYWIDELAARISTRLFIGDDLATALAQARGLGPQDELYESIGLANAHKLFNPADAD